MTTLHFTRGRIAELIADSFKLVEQGFKSQDEHWTVCKAYEHLVNDKDAWDDICRIAKNMLHKRYDSKEFEELVDNVEKMTKDNYHSEALMEIADFFGYNEYFDLFKAYSELPGMTTKDFAKRCEAKERMFILIQVEYGNEVANRLNKVM